jgi:hypothetical protein
MAWHVSAILIDSQEDGFIRAANTAHVIGKPARSRDWFVREALCQKEEMFPFDKFPATFDKEKHVEPIGPTPKVFASAMEKRSLAS